MEALLPEPAEQPPVAEPPERLASLDALRGFDMFFITGGGAVIHGLGKGLENEWFNTHIIPQTIHVPWEGFVAWDLIMPLFLFMVGTAMPFSMAKRRALGQSTARIYAHIVYRVIVLWILGMIAQGHLLTYDVTKFYFFSNTLQAIAAGYLFASILLHFRVIWQLILTVALLMGYWALLTLVPVPEHGAGVLTAEGNLAIYLDKLILGPYQDKTTYTWILSSMTFTTTVMMGAFAGQLLLSERIGKIRKALFLLASGVACLYLGWAWGQIFPIVKHIWTSSMVLYAGGMSLLLLGVFYLVIDVLRLKFLAFPFIVIGVNAIAAYMAVHVINFRDLTDPVTAGLSQWTGQWHDFARAAAGVALLWLILFWMYRKKTFIKI